MINITTGLGDTLAAKKIDSIGAFNLGNRLFYECHENLEIDGRMHFGLRHNTGIFIEILNPKKFISEDYRLKDKEFLDYHNFVEVEQEKQT